MTALILEAHIASLGSKKPFGELLAQSMRLNFDIDLKFPDRNSREILGLNFDLHDGDATTTGDATTSDPDSPDNLVIDMDTTQTNKRKISNSPDETTAQPTTKEPRKDKTIDKPKPQPRRESKNRHHSGTSTDSLASRTIFYMYKSDQDKTKYDTPPNYVDLMYLLDKKLLKIGLKQGHSLHRLKEELQTGKLINFRAHSQIQTTKHDIFNAQDTYFFLK